MVIAHQETCTTSSPICKDPNNFDGISSGGQDNFNAFDGSIRKSAFFRWSIVDSASEIVPADKLLNIMANKTVHLISSNQHSSRIEILVNREMHKKILRCTVHSQLKRPVNLNESGPPVVTSSASLELKILYGPRIKRQETTYVPIRLPNPEEYTGSDHLVFPDAESGFWNSTTLAWLECETDSNPPAHISWYFRLPNGSMQLTGFETRQPVKLYQNGNLLPALSKDYVSTVSTTLGTKDTSDEVEQRSSQEEHILRGLWNFTCEAYSSGFPRQRASRVVGLAGRNQVFVRIGQAVELQCDIRSLPAPFESSIQWNFHAILFKEDPRSLHLFTLSSAAVERYGTSDANILEVHQLLVNRQWMITNEEVVLGWISRLRIQHVTEKHFGLYNCSARNELGGGQQSNSRYFRERLGYHTLKQAITIEEPLQVSRNNNQPPTNFSVGKEVCRPIPFLDVSLCPILDGMLQRTYSRLKPKQARQTDSAQIFALENFTDVARNHIQATIGRGPVNQGFFHLTTQDDADSCRSDLCIPRGFLRMEYMVHLLTGILFVAVFGCLCYLIWFRKLICHGWVSPLAWKLTCMRSQSNMRNPASVKIGPSGMMENAPRFFNGTYPRHSYVETFHVIANQLNSPGLCECGSDLLYTKQQGECSAVPPMEFQIIRGGSTLPTKKPNDERHKLQQIYQESTEEKLTQRTFNSFPYTDLLKNRPLIDRQEDNFQPSNNSDFSRSQAISQRPQRLSMAHQMLSFNNRSSDTTLASSYDLQHWTRFHASATRNTQKPRRIKYVKTTNEIIGTSNLINQFMLLQDWKSGQVHLPCNNKRNYERKLTTIVTVTTFVNKLNSLARPSNNNQFLNTVYFKRFAIGKVLKRQRRWIVHDLLLFLCILLVCHTGYGIAFQSISFANGCYAEYRQEELNKRAKEHATVSKATKAYTPESSIMGAWCDFTIPSLDLSDRYFPLRRENSDASNVRWWSSGKTLASHVRCPDTGIITPEQEDDRSNESGVNMNKDAPFFKHNTHYLPYIPNLSLQLPADKRFEKSYPNSDIRKITGQSTTLTQLLPADKRFEKSYPNSDIRKITGQSTTLTQLVQFTEKTITRRKRHRR
ncbi:hypothetical protein CLF_102093 [Clonorchis sinensis]|uniref:Ig-like domain-containing protein n=1 Tax=Clonorchis sinensis TaxID=79923 RepID=G7Y7A1_CLOSI|nr:hypothetical protein CLF_102093 [Clonorchis sinensis]